MQTQTIPLFENQLSILVVDDSAVLRCAYQKVLQGWGHKVDVASDGLEALLLLQAGHYDLVITDYEMPRCDGIEFFNRAKSEIDKKVQVPFILITGSSLESLEGRLEGFAYALTKPVGLKALKEMLEQFVPTFN